MPCLRISAAEIESELWVRRMVESARTRYYMYVVDHMYISKPYHRMYWIYM